MWGIDGQYSIEFTPVLAIGIFLAISEFKSKKIKNVSAITVLLFATFCTVRTMDHTVLFTNKSKIRFYQASHYKRDYDVKKVYHQLVSIPKDAIVSVQSPFLPHLSLRNNVYQFPIIKDAAFIIYSDKEEPYPLDTKSFKLKTASLENSKEWHILYQQDGFTVLKKTGRQK